MIRRYITKELIATIIAVGILLLIAASCRPTREQCYDWYPPMVATTDSTWTTFIPDSTTQPADSAWSQYLVDCQQTAQGLRAVIVRLLGQGAGQVVQPPTVVIDSNGVLTTQAIKPETIIRYQVRVINSQRVTSSVHVKITNILTWGQKFCVYWFFATLGAILIFIAYMMIKNKWYTILVNATITLGKKLFKKKQLDSK